MTRKSITIHILQTANGQHAWELRNDLSVIVTHSAYEGVATYDTEDAAWASAIMFARKYLAPVLNVHGI